MRYKEGSTESMPIMQIGKSKVDPELKDSSFADPRFDLCTDFWRIDDPAHFINLEDEEDFIF